jgi:sulfur-oxidizing protein SoxA
MKRLVILLASAAAALTPLTSFSSPEEDLHAFRQYFKERFPSVALSDYINGVYAIDAERRAAWQEFESFSPPYEDAVALGKELFTTPFANGKTYASCFPNDGIGIRQNYPHFDAQRGKVVTLEAAINECRVENGEKPLRWGKGKLAAISAYMGFTSRGKTIDVKVPDDPRAQAMYERGKRHFYSKRGQLNFSCADCHVYNSGNHIRADLLSPALGHVSHFPVWRKKWAAGGSGPTAGLGTLHRRYGGCNKQVRAAPAKPQSMEYTALEYFHTYMSNGLKVNAPSLRQ